MFDTSQFHPMVVHFPIAIIIIGFLFDLSSLFLTKVKCLSTMGLYLEVIGMLGAIAAFGTGYYFTSQMEGEAGILKDLLSPAHDPRWVRQAAPRSVPCLHGL